MDKTNEQVMDYVENKSFDIGRITGELKEEREARESELKMQLKIEKIHQDKIMKKINKDLSGAGGAIKALFFFLFISIFLGIIYKFIIGL